MSRDWRSLLSNCLEIGENHHIAPAPSPIHCP
jgi:hypothetical protein